VPSGYENADGPLVSTGTFAFEPVAACSVMTAVVSTSTAFVMLPLASSNAR
jgi:hypothetical protein